MATNAKNTEFRNDYHLPVFTVSYLLLLFYQRQKLLSCFLTIKGIIYGLSKDDWPL